MVKKVVANNAALEIGVPDVLEVEREADRDVGSGACGESLRNMFSMP